MGVFKELAHDIESLIKRQRRIYPDACDFGLPTNEQPLLDQIHKVMLEARESFKVKKTETKYSTGRQVTYEFMIPWEQEGGLYLGTKYVFEYTGTNKKYKNHVNYFTITSERHSQKENPFANG
jgi:hypothetical protein